MELNTINFTCFTSDSTIPRKNEAPAGYGSNERVLISFSYRKFLISGSFKYIDTLEIVLTKGEPLSLTILDGNPY